MTEAFGDEAIRTKAKQKGWDADQYEAELFKQYDVVIDHWVPVIAGGKPNVVEGALRRFWRTSSSSNKRGALLGVAHNDPSKVIIVDQKVFDEMPLAAQKAAAIHETVHQGQLTGRHSTANAQDQAGEASDEMTMGDADSFYNAKMSDLWDKGLREAEAYKAGLDYLLEWMGEHCKDSPEWNASNIPGFNRNLLEESKASVGGALDVDVVEDPII